MVTAMQYYSGHSILLLITQPGYQLVINPEDCLRYSTIQYRQQGVLYRVDTEYCTDCTDSIIVMTFRQACHLLTAQNRAKNSTSPPVLSNTSPPLPKQPPELASPSLFSPLPLSTSSSYRLPQRQLMTLIQLANLPTTASSS